jgi:hypothetical protein
LSRKDPDYGPVTLVTHDGPALGRVAHQNLTPFVSNRDALRHVCAHIGHAGFHDPFIMGPSRSDQQTDLIWDTRGLQRECERRNTAPAALTAVADYTRSNSEMFVRNGPRLLTPTETAKHRQRIEALADQIDALAEEARDGAAESRQFETILGRLHAEGFFPDNELVSTVAKHLLVD